MDLRKLPAIDVKSMIDVSFDLVKGKPRLLPSVAYLLGEVPFFEVGMAWSEEGIHLCFKIETKFEACFFPEVEKGDGVEVFIDTRGIDSAVTIHKYCHHFIFLPEKVNGIQSAEVTRFKSNDRHDPALHENFSVESKIKAHSIEMQITIPEISLFGYNPLQNPKLGFACIVHRSNKEKGHFPQSGVDFMIERCPLLWAKMKVIE